MNEVWNSFFSPAWWVSVVIVGLLINLLSAYLKPPIDSLGSRLSSSWKARSERSRLRLMAAVSRAVNDPSYLSHLQHQSAVLRSKSNGWLVCIALCAVFYALDTILVALAQIHGAPFQGVRTPVSNGMYYLGGFTFVSVVGAMRTAFAAIDIEVVVSLARRELTSDGV